MGGVSDVVGLGLLQRLAALSDHLCVGADRLGDVDMASALGKQAVHELPSMKVDRLLDPVQVVVYHAIPPFAVPSLDYRAVVGSESRHVALEDAAAQVHGVVGGLGWLAGSEGEHVAIVR